MINYLTIIVTVFLSVLTLTIPRKYLLVPYILAACFIPTDQRIIIMGLDFNVLRILVVVGVIRIFIGGEQQVITWNIFDKMVLAWAICGSVIYVILRPNMGAVIYRCGQMFDIIGLYWLFRQSIRSWKDIQFIIKVLSACVLIMVPLIALEWLTKNNPFAILGRVSSHSRLGRLRCQAAFPHAIMFGLFWATLTPLFIGMARVRAKDKKLYYSAAVASIFAVIASASATPLMALFAGLVVLCAFNWRHYFRQIVIALFLSVICLHIIMDAPVWHLIGRIDVVGGSTGWHRFVIIDQAVKRFGEWALLGCRSTAHWGWLTHDVTNQYVLEGVRGGIATLGIFIAILVITFRTLAQLSQRAGNPGQQLLAWCFLATFFVHCVAFIGVAYFGQIFLLWYLMLGIAGFFVEENEKIKKWGPQILCKI